LEHKPNKIELISILICSRDRHDDLVFLVQALTTIASTHPREIVVVEETDEPAPIEGVKYISHPVLNRGIPYARNLAMAHAAGEILLFVDDDCIITDNWLESLLEPFSEDSVVGVQGGVTVPPSSGPIGWAESIIGFPGGGIRRIIESGGRTEPTTEISTLNAAYRRRVVDAVGGFDERLKWGGEDDFFAKKACKHGSCLFVPAAVVTHKPRGTLSGIWKWFIRRGRVDIFFTRIHDYEAPKRYSLFTVLRSSLGIKFLLPLFVLLVFSWAWTLVFILSFLSLYSVVQQVRYFKIWRKSDAGLTSFLLIPIVKLTMDLAADWGRLKGMFVV
jgi:GT2 family glycosyltransferase